MSISFPSAYDSRPRIKRVLFGVLFLISTQVDAQVATEVMQLFPDVLSYDFQFGSAVSADHNFVVVGAPDLDKSTAGAAYLFPRNAVLPFLGCRTPNVPIPDVDFVTDTGSIAGAGAFTDLDVFLDIHHTFVGDLVVTLDHGATMVEIIDRPGTPSGAGCANDNIWAWLDDEASLPIEDECAGTSPTINGFFIPNNPLSSFDGLEAGGDWSLTVSDQASGDTGTLVSWCLIGTKETAWGQQKKLIPAGGNVYLFGTSVSLSGDTIVVGAPEAEESTGQDLSGGAFVFVRDQGGADNWGQVKDLYPTDWRHFDEFGISVNLDDDTLIVGSHRDDDACPVEFDCDSGSAYVFKRNQGGQNAWGQVKKLVASPADASRGDRFGRSVAVAGDLAVVGVPYDDDACPADPGCDSGAAYVFDRNQDGTEFWGQVAELSANDADSKDNFGYSVAISGNTAVVGAPYDDDACVPVDTNCDSGAAYVFARNQGGAGNWGQVAKLSASDAALGDVFGMSVAIDGSMIVVGAPNNSGAGGRTGATYIFMRDEGGANNWGQVQRLIASDPGASNRFGSSVAVGGSSMAVGERRYGDPPDPFWGSAYVFELPLFIDGLESGNTSAWSSKVP